MKCIDIVKPAPKTAYEAYERRMNWMQAELIGQSIFSKTIEVSQRPIDAIAQQLIDWHPEVVSECCGFSGRGGDAIDNPGYCRGCNQKCNFVKETI